MKRAVFGQPSKLMKNVYAWSKDILYMIYANEYALMIINKILII